VYESDIPGGGLYENTKKMGNATARRTVPRCLEVDTSATKPTIVDHRARALVTCHAVMDASALETLDATQSASILEILRAFALDSEVAAACLKAIVHLAQIREQCAMLQRNNARAEVAACVLAFCANDDIALLGCRVFVALSANHGACIGRVDRKPVSKAIVSASKSRNRRDVHVCACLAIAKLAWHVEMRVAFCDNGGCEAVVGALKYFLKRDAREQIETACAALAALAVAGGANALKLIKKCGVCETLAQAALRCTPEAVQDDATTIGVLRTIAALALSQPDARERLGRAGVCESLLVIRPGCVTEGVLSAWRRAVGALAKDSRNRAKLGVWAEACITRARVTVKFFMGNSVDLDHVNLEVDSSDCVQDRLRQLHGARLFRYGLFRADGVAAWPGVPLGYWGVSFGDVLHYVG